MRPEQEERDAGRSARGEPSCGGAHPGLDGPAMSGTHRVPKLCEALDGRGHAPPRIGLTFVFPNCLDRLLEERRERGASWYSLTASSEHDLARCLDKVFRGANRHRELLVIERRAQMAERHGDSAALGLWHLRGD
jgi:hypothetical protein